MKRSPTLLAALGLLAAVLAPAAPAAAAAGLAPAREAREFVPRQVIVKFEGQRSGRTVTLPRGVGVRTAVAALRRNPRVAYAAPNFIARASVTPPARIAPGIPNDSGHLDAEPRSPGGWTSLQWNMLPWQSRGPGIPTSPGGIDAIGAWQNAYGQSGARKRPVVVAVLDTGVAYRAWGKRFRRSPDFTAKQFVRGYDFAADNRLPLDQNGHGTHIAGTIAQKTGNNAGLVGVAHRARLMPVRVLDRNGAGRADDIARGIRFAVDRGADVINMSFNFGCGKRVPGINQELRRAYRYGVVTVASIGNLGAETCVSPPATGPRVIAVGGTTEGGCLGAYSLTGKRIDLVAPGGGMPVAGCPSVSSRPIFQVTLKGGDPGRFGIPATYVGTSMAAAHVSGVAALMLAAGTIERGVSPRGKVNRVKRRLRRTARDIGEPPNRQGTGLIDAARATTLR